MAKRFTDSKLYDQAWFRKLPPRLKCAWEWLCKRCDVVGIWDIDMDRLSFEVGEAVELDELVESFNVQVFDGDKLFIPGFVSFQYGDESGSLSPNNRFHLSIAEKLQARGFPRPAFKGVDTLPHVPPSGVDTLGGVPGTPQGRGRGKGRGQGEEEGGVGETKPVDRQVLSECLVELQKTLDHFGIQKRAEMDELSLARILQTHGGEKLKLALIGARSEQKSKDFDPAMHFTLSRIQRPHIFDKLVNLGAQQIPKKRRVFRPEVKANV